MLGMKTNLASAPTTADDGRLPSITSHTCSRSNFLESIASKQALWIREWLPPSRVEHSLSSIGHNSCTWLCVSWKQAGMYSPKRKFRANSPCNF